MTFEQRILEKQIIAAQYFVTMEAVRNAKLEVFEDKMLHGLFLKLSAEVYREKLLEDIATIPVSFEYEVQTNRRPWQLSGLWLAALGSILMAGWIVAAVYCVIVVALEMYFLLEKPNTEIRTHSQDVDIEAAHWMMYPDMIVPARSDGRMRVAVRQSPIDYHL